MNFRDWLQQELKNRNWSYRELGRQAGLSNALISQVMTSQVEPSCEFVIKVSSTLDTSPIQILQLAGILPGEPTPASPGPITQEVIELLGTLPVEQKKQVLQYIQFLKQQEQD